MHISVKVVPLDKIPEAEIVDQHPNIRKLVNRMDNALSQNDPSAVLHSSASIFETLAKDIVKNPNIANKTLGGFFDSYRKNSKLPENVLDYILDIYNKRNTEPLAGHGSTLTPSITSENALILAVMTKAIVRIERKLGEQALSSSSLRKTGK